MKLDLPGGGLIAHMPMVMEPMEQALRTMEAHCEDKLGWDARPMFLVIAGDPLQALVVASVELPTFVYMNPGEGLPIFVEILTNKDLGAVGDSLRGHLKELLPPLPLLGAVLIHEAWKVHADSKEELDAMMVPPSRHPDRVEIRGGIMVTVDGRMLVIERERGKNPQFTEADMSIGLEMGGRIPDAMRRLLDILESLSRERAK